MKALIPIYGAGDLKLAEQSVEVLWVAFNIGSSNSRCYLLNGPNATADILWECVVLAATTGKFAFDPPMLFTWGLYIDPDTNCDSWVISFRPAQSE